LKPSEFYDLTLFEFFTLSEGYRWRRVQQLNDNATNSWLTSRLVWASKITLESMLIGETKPVREETLEEQVEKLKAMNAGFGGEVIPE
jgi:hypothetical protein